MNRPCSQLNRVLLCEEYKEMHKLIVWGFYRKRAMFVIKGLAGSCFTGQPINRSASAPLVIPIHQ